MATEAQINANRRNAQFSTGPATATGKSNSSRNHLTLGLYTRTDYVKPEERDFYKEFCETMYLELDPAGLLEQTLASEITGASWRLRRCNAAEAELGDFDDATDKTRRSIERARASAHSVLHRSINQLRKLKADRVRNIRQTERAETDALMNSVDAALSGIMNCPEPDRNAIGLGSNYGDAVIAPCDQESASNCEAAKTTSTAALIAALTKRNLPCDCKSGIIYRNCCGKNEPRDWRKAA